MPLHQQKRRYAYKTPSSGIGMYLFSLVLVYIRDHTPSLKLKLLVDRIHFRKIEPLADSIS